MSFLILIFGFGLTVAGFKLGTYYKSNINSAKKVRGEVVALVRKYYGSWALTPLLKVYVNGQDKYLLSSFGSNPPSVEVGENIDVYLDPRNSNRAAAQVSAIPKVALIMKIIGFVMLIVANHFISTMSQAFQAFDVVFLLVTFGIAWSKFKNFRSQEFQAKWREFKHTISLFNEFTPEHEAQSMIDGSYEPVEKFGKNKKSNIESYKKKNHANPAFSKPSEPSPYFGGLVLLIGAALITYAVVKAQDVIDFKETAARAPAKIVDMKVNRGSGTTYTPIISFSPGPGKNEIRFKGMFSSSHPSWKVGDRVHVLYDPNNPEDAMLDDGLWNYFVSILLGFIGLVMLIVGTVNFNILPKTRGRRMRRPGDIPIDDRRIS